MSRLVEEADHNLAPAAITSTVVIFYSLNILAFILVSLVLATAILARNLHRVKAWYAFLFIQLFFTASFFVHPFKTPDFKPDFVPCLLQATLVRSVSLSYAFFAISDKGSVLILVIDKAQIGHY